MYLRLKKIIVYMLIAILLITGNPLILLASADSGIDDGDNRGGGHYGVNTGNQYTWSQAQSGYRFTIIDENF